MRPVFVRTLVPTASLAALLLGCGSSAKKAPEPPAQPAEPAAPAAAEAEPTKAPPPDGPFLYRYDGATGPVYLFGTIHMAVSAKNDLDPVVWDSFTSSKELVLELDPTKVNPMAMMARALDPKGTPLDQQLTPEEWEVLKSNVKTMPEAMLKQAKPWFAQMLLSLAGVDPSTAMEMELIAHANEAGMQIGALETLDDQLNAIESTSDIDALKEAIEKVDEGKAQMKELIAAYKAGKLTKFVELFEADMTDPTSTDALLKNRNEAWVPQIEKMLERGNIFIAVGAGHLYGEHGLLTLLEKRGHEATRILGSDQPAGESAPEAKRIERLPAGVHRPHLQLVRRGGQVDQMAYRR